eukprot:4177213-Prymnesium_polylepis.1
MYAGRAHADMSAEKKLCLSAWAPIMLTAWRRARVPRGEGASRGVRVRARAPRAEGTDARASQSQRSCRVRGQEHATRVTPRSEHGALRAAGRQARPVQARARRRRLRGSAVSGLMPHGGSCLTVALARAQVDKRSATYQGRLSRSLDPWTCVTAPTTPNGGALRLLAR